MKRNRRIHLLICALAGFVLSGCATAQDPGIRYVGVVDTGWSDIPVEQVRVSLPDADGMAGLEARELRHLQTELLQELVLTNDTYLEGENSVTLAVDFGRGGFGGRRQTIGEYAFDEAFVRRTAIERFAGAQRVGKATARQGTYGIFHFISADYLGGRCIYAWQIIDGDELRRDVKRASVQFRACQQNSSVQDLLRIFADLRINV